MKYVYKRPLRSPNETLEELTDPPLTANTLQLPEAPPSHPTGSAGATAVPSRITNLKPLTFIDALVKQPFQALHKARQSRTIYNSSFSKVRIRLHIGHVA